MKKFRPLSFLRNSQASNLGASDCPPGNFVPGASRGFSLVELMIALVIGLLVLLGASQVFVISKRSFDQVEVLADRQQSLRAIFDFLSTDIRTAAEVVEAGEGVLELAYYGARSGDPYCVGEDLYGARYSYSEGVISISVDCRDVAANDGGFGVSNPLLSGLSAVPSFTDEGTHVKSQVSFQKMPGEPDGNESFEFVVALRCMAFNNCARP